MTIQCPTCSKANPTNAAYCFYDGRSLGQVADAGPWWSGGMGFSTPFSFPDGQRCENFDQLALACDRRWNDARDFLANGVWAAFFNRIGRADLAVAADQASREPDRDIGLASLLERLPTEALRQPMLHLLAAVEDLGTLEPGVDHKFEIVISNKGGLVLTGTAVTDCEWLFFGDRQGNVSRKLFQTRDNYTLVARVVGSMLRAGQKPLEGQIVIETNAGTMTVVVKAKVPVKPFPTGTYGNNVLAGAKSPREIAVKAKAHPQEAGPLFEQGAVKGWYASNGWTYPVQGTHGKGKGAVQAFFEALGLSKPPVLEVSTDRIEVEGKVGKRIKESITVSTKEAKFVNAEAHSDQPWVKVQPVVTQGKTATIPLVIEVPHAHGQTLEARVTVQGNGQQRFVIPVRLDVEMSAEQEEQEDKKDSRRTLLAAVLGSVLILVVGIGAITFVMNRQRSNPIAGPGPIIPAPPPDNGNGKPPDGGPPPEVVQGEAWWKDIPGQTLGIHAGELKANAPADVVAIVERVATKSDTDRFTAYQQLAAKLPELARDPKAREPLARFLTELAVHEPSDLNISPLQRGMAGLYLKEGAGFDPAEKGGELESALYANQVLFAALTHRAVSTDRARSLALELGNVFGLGLNLSARSEELAAQTEKLLAERCYHNTLPTVERSIDHALAMRTTLLEKFGKHLSQTDRVRVDVGLIVAALGKGGRSFWSKLEPLYEGCVPAADATTGLKLVELYANADGVPEKKMEGLLAQRFKVAGNPKLSKAEKIAAMVKALTVDPKKPKVSPAERLKQLQKVVLTGLTPDKKEKKNELTHLRDAVKLAHASALSSILFNKDAEPEQFDDLLRRAPDTGPPPTDEKEDKDKGKDKGKEKPKTPGEEGPKVVDASGQPQVMRDQLTRTSDKDPARGTFRKLHTVALQAGQLYTIDLSSTAFRPYVRLELPTGRHLSHASAVGGSGSARITYAPTANGNYRVVVTTTTRGMVGDYTLQVQQGNPFGGFGGPLFGPGPRPPGWMRRFPPPPPFIPGGLGVPGMPGVGGEQPKKEEKKDDKETVSKADLASLADNNRATRVTAFTNITGNLPDDLEPKAGEQIARYLLVGVASDGELDEVSGKLEALAKHRHLLAGLADVIASNDKVVKERAETVVGAIVGQRLRFARDEDWRTACRKPLLERAVDLTQASAAAATADAVAQFLCELYKEQGLALGLESEELGRRTQPALALEDLIRHVAGKVTKTGLPAADKEYLEQVERHLKVARFVADNDLESVVLLQRVWARVLTTYLQEQVPGQAAVLARVRQDLFDSDRDARNVFDQLRVGEEKLLRLWAAAHGLKMP